MPSILSFFSAACAAGVSITDVSKNEHKGVNSQEVAHNEKRKGQFRMSTLKIPHWKEAVDALKHL